MKYANHFLEVVFVSSFFTPRILQCAQYNNKVSFDMTRCVKDYEFDLYIDGGFETRIDGRAYNIQKGCFVLRKPGQHVVEKGIFNSYALTLDFSGRENIAPNNYFRRYTGEPQSLCYPEVFEHFPDAFYPYHYNDLKNIYMELTDSFYPNIANIEFQNKLLEELLLLLLSDVYHHNRDMAKKNKKPTPVEDACRYINRNYANHITLDEIAAYVYLDKNHLVRLFKKSIKTTPIQYLLEMRLFHARLLLMQTTFSVDTIAQKCGFNTTSYFIKCFKEKFSKTPLQYRTSYENTL